jgi:hypothetical protein
VKFGYQFVRVSSRFDKSYPAKNRLSFALLVISNNKRISNNKEIYDGAIFSANGVDYGTLNKLSARTQDKKS